MTRRLRARLAGLLAGLLTLRTAFLLLALSAILAAVAAVTAQQASREAEAASREAQSAAREAQATTAALQKFILASQRADCEAANRSRDDLRHAIADTLTDNLVEAARTPPDPAVVEGYRTGIREDLEADFAARAWDPATRTCVDVPVPP